MKKFLIVLGVLMALFFCFLLLLAGYFGLVPGLSSAMGATKPRDLGVKWTEADLKSAQSKTQTERRKMPPEKVVEAPDVDLGGEDGEDPASTIAFEGSRPVKTEFTSEELTALVNQSTWKYEPVENVQVKVGDKPGTIEVSGNLRTHVLVAYANATGGTTADIIEALEKAKILKGPSFYILAEGTIENDVVTLVVLEAQVGRFTATPGILSQHGDKVRQFLQERIDWFPGLEVVLVTLEDGVLVFDGMLPEVEETLPR